MMDWLRQMLGPAGRLHRRHPGHRLHRYAGGAAHRPGAASGHAGEPGWPAGRAHGVCLHRGAFLGGQGRSSSPDTGWTGCGMIAGGRRLRHEAGGLERAMAGDLAGGLIPACVVATVGTTSSTAMDPLPAIGEIAGATASGCTWTPHMPVRPPSFPSCARLFDGVELADSFVFNPHKWLLTNFDCTRVLRARSRALLRTFQATSRVSADRARPRGRQLPRLGHPAGPAVPRPQALVRDQELRRRGSPGDAAAAHRAGPELGCWVAARARVRGGGAGRRSAWSASGYEPPALTGDASALDRWNEELLRRVNAPGDVYLTHTMLGGRYTLRMAIGQRQTERAARAARVGSDS